MYKKLKKINHDLDFFFKKKPFLYALFSPMIIAGSQMMINIYHQSHVFANFEYIVSIFFFSMIGYLAFRISPKKEYQFWFCLFFAFIIFLIKNHIEKSIVDYTSIILILFFTVLIGSVSWILAVTLTSRKKVLEDSNNGTTKS